MLACWASFGLRAPLALLLVLACTAPARSLELPLDYVPDDGLDRPFVVGGSTVSPGQFPFVVRIATAGGGVCTGSLIRGDWVLTAAHCVQPLGIWVSDAAPGLLGPTHLVATLDAIQWVPHPSYNPGTAANDIAVFHLEDDARLYPPSLEGAPIYFPQTIGLATAPANTNSGVGPVTVIGFGQTDSAASPAIANYASGLPSVAAAACDFSISGSRQLCYGTYPNACFGDSGGPVVQGSLQAGVVSYGPEICGTSNSVATYVPHYVDWINDVIDPPAATPAPTAQPTPGPTPVAPPADAITLIWELPPKKSNGVATGISNAQGITFSSAGTITSVELLIDGKKEGSLPWPSERGDSPGPVLSGFSGVVNWGRFSEGTHQAKLVVKDSKGNKKSETRTVKTVKVMPGVNFARDLSADDASCSWTAPDTFECTGLDFKQGSCAKTTTFKWSNGKQAMEIVEGCH